MSNEYAAAGVDIPKIKKFKKQMVEVVRQSRDFPNVRQVVVDDQGCYEYQGKEQHAWKQVTEGLGNKNVLAEILYKETGIPRFGDSALDSMRMAFNDVAAFGAMPVTYTDEVAAGNSEWFADFSRGTATAQGYLEGCKHDHVALVGGESPSLRYLVKDFPVMSGCAVGIIAPSSLKIDNARVGPKMSIVGALSSGLHANGASLALAKGPQLPEGFFSRLPGGNTFIEEILTPTISYVGLVEALQKAEIPIAGIVPGTGGGLAKLIEAIPHQFTYRLTKWVEVPQILLYMQEQFNLSLRSCLETFNWGIGYYLFVHSRWADAVCLIGEQQGYRMALLGQVEDGPSRVVYEPDHITLVPSS